MKEENAWDIILELTKVDFFLDFFFFKYCISRDVMQSNFFFPRGQVLVLIKFLFSPVNDWGPSSKLRGPGFGGKLNSTACQALILLYS